MKRQLLYLIICLYFNSVLSAASGSEGRDSVTVNDGPYISYLNDTLKVLRIENSLLREEYILPGDRSKIKITSHQSSDYKQLINVSAKNLTIARVSNGLTA